MQQLKASAPATKDVFRRTLLWGSLWDSVRESELNPADYLRLALDALQNEHDESLDEHDESLVASILAHTETAIHRYLPNPAPAQGERGMIQPEFLAMAQTLAVDRMMKEPDHDLRIIWFRSLAGFAVYSQFTPPPSGGTVMKELLNGRRTIPGVELRQQDRWSLVTALIAYKDPEAETYFAAEQKRDPSGDGLKYAWIAQAARPDAATKQKYFADYTRWPSEETSPGSSPRISEDWIQSSLGAFNYWNQSQLTAPYLEQALEALPHVKRERKIFFLVAWLDAFVDGQQSLASLEVVKHYLETANPDSDLRLKVLEATDELERTVRIRAKYAAQ